jgi:hypothetical protein
MANDRDARGDLGVWLGEELRCARLAAAERHAEDIPGLPARDADHARRHAQPRLAGFYPGLIIVMREDGARHGWPGLNRGKDLDDGKFVAKCRFGRIAVRGPEAPGP